MLWRGAGTAGLIAGCKKEKTTLAGALAAAFLKTAANTKELKEKKKDDFSFTRYNYLRCSALLFLKCNISCYLLCSSSLCCIALITFARVISCVLTPGFAVCSLVDCRKFFDPSFPEDTIGNFVGGIPQSQQVKEGVSFWDLARSVSATTEKEVSKSKHFSEIPVLNMLFSQVTKLFSQSSIISISACNQTCSLIHHVDRSQPVIGV